MTNSRPAGRLFRLFTKEKGSPQEIFLRICPFYADFLRKSTK
jgi:hypothetical protein